MTPSTNPDGVKPVFFTTPDGVERQVRFTLGAKKRIGDRFGMSLTEAMNKYDAGALPELLYCCMFDADGKPPANLNLTAWLEDPSAPEQTAAMMAALMSAAAQGRVEKNELEAVIRRKMEEQVNKLTGFTSGASPISASASLLPNSGS